VQPDPIGEVDRLIEEDGVVGLKAYQYGIRDWRGVEVRMDDPEAGYQTLELSRCPRAARSCASPERCGSLLAGGLLAESLELASECGLDLAGHRELVGGEQRR
jgi:hypothetical protein